MGFGRVRSEKRSQFADHLAKTVEAALPSPTSNRKEQKMNENAKATISPALTGGAMIFGMLSSEIATAFVEGQSFWLRILVRAVTAGALAAIFVLVANRWLRK